jgi:predicted nucleotide-binding protein
MLDNAWLAFLVMTAEDERTDGTKQARANVIHEVGLFQGRLGFERAIILLEEGCSEFSNIVGLTQIRSPPKSCCFRSRGDKTAIELFLAGVRDFNARIAATLRQVAE